MKFTDEQKKQLVQAVLTAFVTLVLAVAGILGYNVGIKPALDANSGAIGALGTGVQQGQIFRTVRATQSMQNDGALTQTGAATFASTADIAGATTVGGGYGSTGCSISAAGVLQCDGAATLASTLTLGANQFSGAVRGGSSTAIADGGTITHTFASPPNWCTVSPYTIGMTATVATVTTTTMTINVNKTGNVYWSCGF